MLREEQYLAPGAAAARLYVHTKTLLRWAKTGRLRYVRTSGGHHRYAASDIENLVASARRTRKRVCDGCGS